MLRAYTLLIIPIAHSFNFDNTYYENLNKINLFQGSKFMSFFIKRIGCFMAKGKKCPSCGNWTMHEKRKGYWYCSSCGASTFD